MRSFFRKHQPIWLAGFFLFLFVHANAAEKAPSIQRNWKFTGKEWKLGQSTIAAGDTIIFLEKSFSAGNSQHSVKGSYLIRDKELLLIPDPDYLDVAVDSLRLSLQKSGSQVDLYSNGKKVGQVTPGTISGICDTFRFSIAKLTGNELTLHDAAGRYTFSYKSPVFESGFSLQSLLRGFLGILTLVVILFLFSVNRRRIPWGLVITGIVFQIIFALLVLKVPFVQSAFEFVSQAFVSVLEFTKQGSTFLFGDKLLDTDSFGFVFVFQILPTIIFFSALTSILYYLGVLQWIVYGLAWLMGKTMKISGAENLSAAANIFLGQTESPLLIKPYLSKMTRSELLCVMVGGMATTAGGVMAAYVGFLGGSDPEMQLFFAKHLLASSVMSAPATIVVAKMLIPQTEEISTEIKVPKEKLGTNVLEAIANGTTDGLKLAVNVGAMLIVFIALVAMVNSIFTGIGSATGLNDWVAGITDGQYTQFSLQFILGYTLAPLMWMLGVESGDIALVGQLLGEKTVLNEFIAYKSLGEMRDLGMFASQKSVIMSTYLLCGFANFASIGIQIGGIGALAPDKKPMLSQLGMRALLGGTIAALFTAVVVGMLM